MNSLQADMSARLVEPVTPMPTTYRPSCLQLWASGTKSESPATKTT